MSVDTSDMAHAKHLQEGVADFSPACAGLLFVEVWGTGPAAAVAPPCQGCLGRIGREDERGWLQSLVDRE